LKRVDVIQSLSKGDVILSSSKDERSSYGNNKTRRIVTVPSS
jgi:hypothetical protein